MCDFGAGILVRRFSVVAVAFLSHITSLVTIGIVTVAIGASPDREGFLLGVAAGMCTSVASTAFFKAMALGRISVASPLLACGSLVAFGLAIAAGERPSALAVAGCLLALGGAVIVSLHEHASGGIRKSAVAFALVAAIASGLALYLVGHASNQTGTAFAVLGSRTSSSVLLLLLAVKLRPIFPIARPWLIVVVALGMGSGGALFLFGLAAQTGLVSIASILSTLYPVVTITLAHVFLAERLRGVQLAGVCLALAGIALVTAGR